MLKPNLVAVLVTLIGLSGLCGLGYVLPATASAAVQNKPGGISISPFVQQITVQPSDGAKSFSLTVTNLTDSLQEIGLSTHDFGSLNDSGGVLLDGNSGFTQKYGLTSWLGLESDTVVLPPKESRAVQVSINNRQSLQPGGHYGAVVASVKSLNDNSGNKVVIKQQLLSLLLVDKTGGEHYDLKLDNISQNGNWVHLPNKVRLRFQNPGNVHVIPRGTVKLTSPGGTVLAKGIINSESAFVLPESFREIYVQLNSVSKGLSLPGIYHIQVEYRYDGVNKTVAKNFAVKYINLKIYLGLGLILALILVIIVRRKRLKQTTRNQG